MAVRSREFSRGLTPGPGGRSNNVSVAGPGMLVNILYGISVSLEHEPPTLVAENGSSQGKCERQSS